MLPTDFNLTFKFDPMSSLYFAGAGILIAVVVIGLIRLILR